MVVPSTGCKALACSALRVGMRNGTATRENSMVLLMNLHIHSLCNPMTSLCSPRQIKTCAYLKPYAQIFTATLFTIAKTVKQPK